MNKWVVWAKDDEDMMLWSGTNKSFLIAYQNATWILDKKLISMQDCSLVVINAVNAKDIFYHELLPKEFEDWCNDARLWAHLGDVTGEPKNSEWPLFNENIKGFRGLPAIKLQKAFGSTYDPGHLRDMVAPEIRRAIRNGSELDVDILLQQAWDKAGVQAKSAADEKVLEALNPLYLLLTHPNKEGIETAIQSVLDVAHAKLRCNTPLIAALISLVRDIGDKGKFQKAEEEFCDQFRRQSEKVTNLRFGQAASS